MQVQALNTTQVSVCLETLKPFLSTRLSTPTTSTQHKQGRGRPRVAPLWLLVALAVLKHELDMTWRQYADALRQPNMTRVHREFGARGSPAKSTLHYAWGQVQNGTLQRVLTDLGWRAARDPRTRAIDSTSFEMTAGST